MRPPLTSLQVRLPSLREHAEVGPELVAHFLEELPHASSIPPAVLEGLYHADYPGNVRQLRNAVERATLGLDEAPGGLPPVMAKVDLETPLRAQKDALLSSFERRYLEQMLEACAGNVSEAARRSGLSRVHLHELLRRYRLARYEGVREA
jgi:DNA-binding NtrC family response regulator